MTCPYNQVKGPITQEDLKQIIDQAYQRGFNDALRLTKDTFSGIIDDLIQTAKQTFAATPRQPYP